LPCSINCGFHLTNALSFAHFLRLMLTYGVVWDNTSTNRTTGLFFYMLYGAKMSSLRPPLGAIAAHRHWLHRFIVGVLTMSSIGEMAAAGGPTRLKDNRSCCNLVELRRYTLHPGQRDTLIELFDREFVESQEALGVAVIGQFRDLDRPDRFVWLRGFASIDARGQALAAFYDGPVWHAHREAANATMIDSNNVLLLEPADAGAGFSGLPPRVSPTNTANADSAIVVATLYYTQPDSLEAFRGLFNHSIRKNLERAGARTVAEYITSTQANNFPRLPIRAGEHIFLWLARFESARSYDVYQARLAADRVWTTRDWPNAREHLMREPEVLRLAPTARSRLRGGVR
jgi:hypothetical protein